MNKNKFKNILIKGFYTFQTYEYTLEKATEETKTFLDNNLKYINNISDIMFVDIFVTNKKDNNIIYVFFEIKSVDIKNNFIENKYLARKDIEELEGLLGIRLSIELE